VAMLVGVIFYLINSSSLLSIDGPLDPWVDLAAISSPFSIWLFARNLFERSPERRILLVAAVVLLIGWFIGHFVPALDPLGFYILHIAALGLLADLVRIALFERVDDLVEQRRVVRLWLPLLVAAQAAVILLFETLAGSPRLFPAFNLVTALLILVVMLFAGLALLRTDPELLVETEEDASLPEAGPTLDLTPSEQMLHEKLVAAMAAGAYRTSGLTIAALAEALGTPEHRLRALINQRLGHRNFSAFLNRHRIAEARQLLASREHIDLPILTIAMDLGYNSLPPFNRAFRAETGTTPSEYRREAIEAGQN
jgi:AraC-like DNA-binding protein